MSAPNRAPLALAVSGGLDSTAAYHYAQRVLGLYADQIRCVYVDLGHPYRAKEQRALRDLGIPHTVFPLPLVALQGRMPTATQETIPARNLVIAAVLASLGERVWIVGTLPDAHVPDKCPAFYTAATAAASQAMGAPTRVETPFGSWTKDRIVRWGLDRGLGDVLDRTVSCYHPSLRRCGDCHVCAHRFLAFLLAGRDTGPQYAQHPLRSTAGAGLLARYRAARAAGDERHYDRHRVDTHLALAESYLKEHP